MWLKQDQFEELQRRVQALEDATWCPRAPYPSKLGRVVGMILDHLGVNIERQTERDYIAKKGGPERGSS